MVIAVHSPDHPDPTLPSWLGFSLDWILFRHGEENKEAFLGLHIYQIKLLWQYDR